MSSDYRVIIGDSRRMTEVPDESVHLIVTSPPYPMVSIWDEFFAEASAPSYNEMHEYLNETWREIRRVLIPGGIACINIGDATRTSNGVFHLYPNHSRIIENFEKLGFVTLPYVLWKKPTNRPHYKGKGAFLGSGFLPPNAYVTLDPFLGSGTTLKVAMELDRKFVGYEKFPQLAEFIKSKVGSSHRQVEFLEQRSAIKELAR